MLITLKLCKGLAVSLSRRWNRLWNRSGKVFADRYHRRDLTSPRQTLHALRYVFANFTKHTGRRIGATLHHDDGTSERVPYVDHNFSTALYFPDWKEEYMEAKPHDALSAPPRSWLLKSGYRRSPQRLSVLDAPSRS